MATDALAGFTKGAFTHDGATKDVYRAGEGPAVIVISEVPGITPRVAGFAREVVDAGFSAVMPSLFGTPGKEATTGYALRSIVGNCVSKEFVAFAKGRTSPVTVWLRALAKAEHDRCGGPGVGVVGMCFTGGFALAMMVDDVVLAPVLSQPSLPIVTPFTKDAASDLGISDADLRRVKERCAAEDDLCVLGLRFTGDALSPGARFRRLEQELGDSFVGVEIDSGPGNAGGYGRRAHSVLTEDRDQAAVDRVLQLFRSRLLR
jgi:dienelactone hydrolase